MVILKTISDSVEISLPEICLFYKQCALFFYK